MRPKEAGGRKCRGCGLKGTGHNLRSCPGKTTIDATQDEDERGFIENALGRAKETRGRACNGCGLVGAGHDLRNCPGKL